jgi:hypothetical protein
MGGREGGREGRGERASWVGGMSQRRRGEVRKGEREEAEASEVQRVKLKEIW